MDAAVVVSDDQPPRKRVKVTNPIRARVELVNGMFPIDQETKDRMNKIRDILEDADRELEAIFIHPEATGKEKEGEEETYVDACRHDKGRVIHGFDLIQQAKNSFIDGLLLPKAEK